MIKTYLGTPNTDITHLGSLLFEIPKKLKLYR